MNQVNLTLDFQMGYSCGQDTAGTNPLLNHALAVRNVALFRYQDISQSMTINKFLFTRGFVVGYQSKIKELRNWYSQ